MRFALGIVLASIVLYFFGFLWWGLGPYATLIWDRAEDEEQAARYLKEQFPRNGVYYLPGASENQEEASARFESGPVAFVHMLAVDGRPMMDAGIMLRGFLNNLVAIVLMALLLRKAAPALRTYWESVQFIALAGLTAVVLLDFGMAVWWEISWNWQLYQAVYDLLFYVIAGLVLAPFVVRRPASDGN